MLQQTYIDRLITTALDEDIHYIDVTTDNLLDDAHTSEAYYLAKDSGVLCGIDIAKRVFELVGGDFTMDIRIHDGEQVKKGDIIATMTGSTKTLLKGERTALNILQHMSGIATATHQCVELVAGTNAQITDTRKTLPGLRPLQKYAVTVGGGKNHRYNLSDGAMLKDNHIDAYGGITPAVAALRKKIGHMVKIEVEVRTLEELEEALSAGADISSLHSSQIAISGEIKISPFVFSLSIMSKCSNCSVVSAVISSVFIFKTAARFGGCSFRLFKNPSICSFVPCA